MYQVTLTATEFTAHTRVTFSIWELHGDGGKHQVMNDVMIVPWLSGGLFESSPETATQNMIKWLAATRPEFVDTDE